MVGGLGNLPPFDEQCWRGVRSGDTIIISTSLNLIVVSRKRFTGEDRSSRPRGASCSPFLYYIIFVSSIKHVQIFLSAVPVAMGFIGWKSQP